MCSVFLNSDEETKQKISIIINFSEKYYLEGDSLFSSSSRLGSYLVSDIVGITFLLID